MRRNKTAVARKVLGRRKPAVVAKSSKKFKPVRGKRRPRSAARTEAEKAPGVSSSRAIPAPSFPQELPFSYNETKLVLLARDPFWGFTYWDFSSETWDWIQSLYREHRGMRPQIRVHHLERGSDLVFEVGLEAKNWYLPLQHPNATFEAELGLLDRRGRFYVIAKSNRIHTPPNGPSEQIDREWMPVEFEEIYRLSGGGQTLPSSPGSQRSPNL